MLHGIRKPNSRRPVVSNVVKESEEKLVRDKCSNCKKLFLASRPHDHHDLKTCDNCLALKKVPDVAGENTYQKVGNNLPEPVPQLQNHLENPTSRLCEITEFSENEKHKKVENAGNTADENLTNIPSRLGSYSVRHKIMHNDYFLNIGDIVSLHSEGINYYAQITVFIESEFCEKYAALIWLLPTTLRSNDDVGFDPFAFVYGPQDESFYDVKQLKFVMHPPTQFYKSFIPPVPKNSEILGFKHKHKVNSKRKN